LDYASYDPAFDPARSRAVFRGNLLLVDKGNADRFLEAMAPFELQAPELARFLRKDGPSNWPLSVFVDFDGRFYVNGFTEIPIHEYLPPGWRGVEGSPLDFAPETIRHVWLADPDGRSV
jgi:hypothetical protein